VITAAIKKQTNVNFGIINNASLLVSTFIKNVAVYNIKKRLKVPVFGVFLLKVKCLLVKYATCAASIYDMPFAIE